VPPPAIELIALPAAAAMKIRRNAPRDKPAV
jgi:hypothetical protein